MIASARAKLRQVRKPVDSVPDMCPEQSGHAGEARDDVGAGVEISTVQSLDGKPTTGAYNERNTGYCTS